MTPAERLILQALSVLLQAAEMPGDPLNGALKVVLDQIEAVLDSQTADEVDGIRG